MTIKQELEQLRQENVSLQQHIDHLNEHLDRVCRMRDSYAKTLQEVCIELSRSNNENTT